MTTRFVDTSALLAFLDRSDRRHEDAAILLTSETGELVSHRYVEVETLALTQARLGHDTLRALIVQVLPAIRIEPVSREVHEEAVEAMVATGPSRVSFVDLTSFAFMRAEGIQTAVAFDRDFQREGFTIAE